MVNITSATMVKQADGSAVPLRPPLAYGTDVNHSLSPFQAVLVPDAPLQAMTTYSVTISGTNTLTTFDPSTSTYKSTGTNPAISAPGGAFTKTFTFWTGS